MGATQFDNAFVSGVCLNHKPVKTRRYDFVLFRQQKDCRRATRFCVRDAVEISRDLRCDWTSQQPQVPPAKLAQDHFAQRRWIMQNQSGDSGRARCGHVKRSRYADARSICDDWRVSRFMS